MVPIDVRLKLCVGCQAHHKAPDWGGGGDVADGLIGSEISLRIYRIYLPADLLGCSKSVAANFAAPIGKVIACCLERYWESHTCYI